MDFSTYQSAPSPAWGMYTVTMVIEILVRALSATVRRGENGKGKYATSYSKGDSIFNWYFSLFLAFFVCLFLLFHYKTLPNIIQAVLKRI